MRSLTLAVLFLAGLSCMGARTPVAAAKAPETIPFKLGILTGRTLESGDGTKDLFPVDEFQQALYYSLGENDAKLAKCGYRVQAKPSYFQSGDRVSPKTLAEQLEADGVWMIWGPISSHEYLSAKKGLKYTPMISSMAGARAVTDLPQPFFTMYPTIDVLARAAIEAAASFGYGKRYGVFVDAGCPSCKDFASEFWRQSMHELERVFWLDTVGEKPDLLPLKTEITAKRIDFLLIPDMQALTGYTIRSLHQNFPNLKFVGADWWGDEQVSSLEQYDLPPTVAGISVRGGRSAREMVALYNTRSLYRTSRGQAVLPGYDHFMVVDFMRTLTANLCQWKPKTAEEFRKQLLAVQKDHFRSRAGVGVFQLNGSSLTFSHFLLGLK